MYIPGANRKIKQGIKNFTNNIKKNIKTWKVVIYLNIYPYFLQPNTQQPILHKRIVKPLTW